VAATDDLPQQSDIASTAVGAVHTVHIGYEYRVNSTVPLRFSIRSAAVGSTDPTGSVHCTQREPNSSNWILQPFVKILTDLEVPRRHASILQRADIPHTRLLHPVSIPQAYIFINLSFT
jgi:hypothetical protein